MHTRTQPFFWHENSMGLSETALENYKAELARIMANANFSRSKEELEKEGSSRPYFDTGQDPPGGKKKKVQGGGGCPNCLDPSTIGNNLFGLTYPGPNNPRSYNGEYNYSYVPTNLAEYPAIGHDRRYDKLKIKGAWGLFTDTRAIGADWRFVIEELSITANPYLSPIDRATAGILGLGVGVSVLPKTLFELISPFGFIQTLMWYNYSNIGVTNAPSIHKH